MADLKPRASSPGRRARTVPARHLQEECRLLESVLRRGKIATPEEIDPYKPGGEANPARDAFGWLAYLKRLSRLHARQDTGILPTGSVGPVGRSDEEAVIKRASIGEPTRLALLYPVGALTHVVLSYLSGYALSHVDARDGIMDCLSRHATALARSRKPSEAALRAEVMAEIDYQDIVCCWIATSDALPGLPFDPVTDPRPDVPQHLLGLHTFDRARILGAFHQVNGAALAVLRRRISVDTAPGSGRVGSWQTLTATLETESHHQVTAGEFWRNRGLVPLFTNRVLAGQEQERQQEEAKREAEAEVKRGRR